MNDLSMYLEPGGRRTELVVLVHGMGKLSDRLADVRAVLRSARPDADLFAPKLGYADSLLCKDQAESIVAALVAQIDAFDAARGEAGYSSITLVGHSLGAVIARKIAIVAYGEQRTPDGDVPAPFEREFAPFRAPRAWADRIGRLVLLAGMNRGWSAASTMDWLAGVWIKLGEFIGETLGGDLTPFAIRRGAPFLVQTRLQWLRVMDPDCGRRPETIVVQLLGTGDDLVSPDDNVDYSIDLYGSGAAPSYFYVEVAGSNHTNVVQMAIDGPAETADARAERRAKFLCALNDDRASLATIAISRLQMADNLPPLADPAVENVVFVIHGIRDKGFWTQKIARKIKALAPAGTIASWTESYGYFAMLPFLLRRVRQRKVEWLMDRYVEARARYPKAKFHFVGHSNGTYLAAEALQKYPAVRFERIVFAGSVVRTEYPWKSLMKSPDDRPNILPQVGSVLNYVATHDWVVALLTNGLRCYPWFNLGGAGHNGFVHATPAGPVHQINYIPGSHGVGHEEANWSDIAQFIVHGIVPPKDDPRFTQPQNALLKQLGKVSVVLFPGFLAVLLVLGLLQLPWMFGVTFSLRWAWHPVLWDFKPPAAYIAVLRAIGFFCYVGLLSIVVTRV